MRFAFTLAFLLTSVVSAFAVDPYANVDPYWILVHEPAVKEELGLTPQQRTEYQRALDRLDLQFFPLRNRSAKEAKSGLDRLVPECREQIEAVLKPAQQTRLTQILYRRLGWQSLMREEVVRQLKLSEKQQQEVSSIVEETRKVVTGLEKEASEGKPRGPLEEKFREARADEQKRILEQLSSPQRTAWSEMLGKSFDLAKLGQPEFKAPELVSAGEWVNSPGMRLADLRGKVVVVHFYAFGCLNCIHNYPAYRDWQQRFKNDDVVLLGIHTPETNAERDVLAVRQKAAKEKFGFPILIDGANENWNAWGNSMWPSVYVVDKRGYVRNFWPGELNWQGQEGEKFIRERIESLAKE
jgi:peroxiredoxin